MQAIRRPRSGMRAVITALAGALALGLAGCGSTDDVAGGEAGITIPHAHGETVVEGTPTKIIALGNQWLDAVQVLGVTPIAYIDNVATLARTTPPWEPKSLESAKALETGGNVAEQVAALEPDLILADAFIADRQTYNQLSKIAPTLPALTDDAVTPWQDQVTVLGRVLNKQAEADKVIAEVNAKIDGIARANPGLRDKTFVSSWLAGPTQLMVLNDPEDGSGQVFTRLGMDIPENIKALPSHGGRVGLSPERVDELTADLLIAGYSTGMDERYRQLPGYADLPSVRKNAVVFFDNVEISAVNQPTALSLPHILDKLEPALVNAAK